MVKVETHQLRIALLAVALQEYADIPAEEQIDHTFSPLFRKKARELNTKSQRKAWRCWNIYRRRVILIAVIVAMLSALAACAPIIRRLYIEYFVVDNGITYGITFDPEQAASAPKTMETYMCPEYKPTNYDIVEKRCLMSTVTYIWLSEDGSSVICYDQHLIPKDASFSSWINIDAENTTRETTSINGYAVELFIAEEHNNLVAVWTDNSYVYTINISSCASNKIDIVKEIMDRLVAVDPADYTG